MDKPLIEIYLANPRGFCAGVERAVAIVELALGKYGAPVYVRHEIVHNKFVIDQLKLKGAIFVDEINDIPRGAVTIFSAHGVGQMIKDQAKEKDLQVINATCPLVTKVQLQAKKFSSESYKIVLIGHKNHPEVVGIRGSIKDNIIVVENKDDIPKISYKEGDKIAYITQTTLNVDDTSVVIDRLKKRFPQIVGPNIDDICYATQNRQNAVKKMMYLVDKILVIGANNSSNSNRLHEIALNNNVQSHLISGPSDISIKMLEGIGKIGITAGASAPEELVQKVISHIKTFRHVQLLELLGTVEKTRFRMPTLF
jgi:4-hydroxy-3-methylbut-2-enyl diphosphate reductase